MQQTPTAHHLHVYPSGIVHVEGSTEKERRVGLYISGNLLETLRKTFKLAETYNLTGERLGHAFWHIRERRPAPCESCKTLGARAEGGG